MSSLAQITLTLICFLNTAVGFNINQLIHKKMQKEITKVFSCKDFKLEELTGTQGFQFEKSTFLLDHKIFKIDRASELLGYAFVGTAPSKTDAFEYLIIFDPNFIQKKAKILVYREDYGGEISSSRWLSQFMDSSPEAQFVYGDNISAISGATISVKSMTNSINHVYSQLQLQLSIASR